MSKRLETWQIWHAMRKTIGDSFIMAVLGRRNARTIRMYAQDPRFTVDRCKDPIESLGILFAELESWGRHDIAKLAIDHLCKSIGHETDLHCPTELKQTIDAELLADYQAVADLKTAIEVDAGEEAVHFAMTAAVQEIERTYSKYLQQQG